MLTHHCGDRGLLFGSLVFLCVGVITVPGGVASEDKQLQGPQRPTAPSITHLPEVRVTAKLRPMPLPEPDEATRQLGKTPGAVNRVEAKQYREAKTSNLRDALDYQPGIWVQSRHGLIETHISIRGSGIQFPGAGDERGIWVWQDGVSLTRADGVFSPFLFDPLFKKELLVWRGASASDDAASALGGAIVARSYTGYDSPVLQARTEAGSFGYVRALLSSGWVDGPWDGYTAVSHFSENGFRQHASGNSERVFSNLGWEATPDIQTRWIYEWTQGFSLLPMTVTRQQALEDPQAAAPFALQNNTRRAYTFHLLGWDSSWLCSPDARLDFSAYWMYSDISSFVVILFNELANDFGGRIQYTCNIPLWNRPNECTLGFYPQFDLLRNNQFRNVAGLPGRLLSSRDAEAANLIFWQRIPTG
ncbi:TonB-dependent receptor plug domain-containing protein [Candidatus Methylacidithermus pantelleriae]|nr:TonB-dependent receptor plug domain-containing protein [Candidatus Methylacidithermus pantelleriae]